MNGYNFDYVLPLERIAQRPIGFGSNRHSSKLLVANGSGNQDLLFKELPTLLAPGDMLILNNSRTRPSRFFVKLLPGDLHEAELLLVSKINETVEGGQCWRALARPMKRFNVGMELSLGMNLKARVIGRDLDERYIKVELTSDSPDNCIQDGIENNGMVPIPPYIRGGKSDELDKESYQTVFSKESGSIATPTAGLHSTEELLEEIVGKGITVDYITLHIGPSSILPLDAGSDLQSVMAEKIMVSAETKWRIVQTRRNGQRIVAVGTTTVRAIESLADKLTEDQHSVGETSLFIKPGYSFKVVDAMVTNFHQPRSTHLQLVSAFVGEERIRDVYNHALRGTYRFLSYGDAMYLSRSSSPCR